MQKRRVVITGLGAVSPYGPGVPALWRGLSRNESVIRLVEELTDIAGVGCHVGGLVTGVDPKLVDRKHRRAMSPMSIYATLCGREALGMAGAGAEECASGRLAVSIASTIGSPHTLESFFGGFSRERTLERTKAGTFFQVMSHTCASNVAQALGVTGRIIAPAAACSSSGQAIGLAYEMIATGRQDMALAGGADEFHPLVTGTFDVIGAASTGYNDRPHMTPRPFDAERDGVVCSEGCGLIFMESFDSARARGAKILGEVTGFATVSDPTSIANPGTEAIVECLKLALADAGTAPGEVDYVNAHATATIQGDSAECQAVRRILGEETPISSLKGHLGHTLGASGALEIAATLVMAAEGKIIGTLNLERVDPECQGVAHITKTTPATIGCFLKNNFALGGIYTSLVLRGPQG